MPEAQAGILWRTPTNHVAAIAPVVEPMLQQRTMDPERDECGHESNEWDGLFFCLYP